MFDKIVSEEVARVNALHKTKLSNIKFFSGPLMFMDQHMVRFHVLRLK